MRASRSRAIRRFWCWLRSSWELAAIVPAALMLRAQPPRQLGALLIVEREVVHGDRDRHGAVGRVDVLAAGPAGARCAEADRRVGERALAGGDRVIRRRVGHPRLLHTMPHARLPRALPGSERPLIGVIHLPPLPGYPDSPGLAAVVAHALAELAVYRVGGLDGVLVENENDSPHRVTAASETIAAMTRVTHALVAAANRLPVGIEILLNDPEASLAVAHCSGADFIRTDYFADEMQRPEYGAMRIAPADVVAYRARIGAQRVLILADIQVKYAQMIAPRTLADVGARGGRAGRRCRRGHGQPHRGAALAAATCWQRARAPASARCSSAAASLRATPARCLRSQTAPSWARA